MVTLADRKIGTNVLVNLVNIRSTLPQKLVGLQRHLQQDYNSYIEYLNARCQAFVDRGWKINMMNDVIDETIYADGTTLCTRGISLGVDFLATWNSSTKSFYINGTVSDENKIGGFDSLTNSTKSKLYFDSTKYDSLKGISGNFNISVGTD